MRQSLWRGTFHEAEDLSNCSMLDKNSVSDIPEKEMKKLFWVYVCIYYYTIHIHSLLIPILDCILTHFGNFSPKKLHYYKPLDITEIDIAFWVEEDSKVAWTHPNF